MDLYYKLSVARRALPRQLLVAQIIKVIVPGRRFGKSCDGCNLVSTLCEYDLRKGDLFVLSWARMRQGIISS